METSALIYNCLKLICCLIAFIYFLKFVQSIGLRVIEKKENRQKEDSRSTEQVEIQKRKIEIMDKQEEIRKLERLHEIGLKK